MPTLDVTDVLLSPEFLDTTLVVKRNEQTVDDDGFPKTSAQKHRLAAW